MDIILGSIVNKIGCDYVIVERERVYLHLNFL
jgi:hypothetical protein